MNLKAKNIDDPKRVEKHLIMSSEILAALDKDNIDLYLKTVL